MKKIPLTQGKFAIVDDADFKYLNQWKWQAQKDGERWYAVRWRGHGETKMHRLIVDSKRKIDIDHSNGNGLDNRRGNLRACERSQNCCNTKKRSDNTSGYRGVSRCSSTGKWRVQIQYKGQKKYLGIFVDKIFAASRFNEAAKQLHGDFAKLN